MTNSCDFFLGCSSPGGFFGFWEALQEKGGPRLYLIKSGPGCGKSTLMKELGRRAGEPVQRIHCSSDPNSLDGVYFPKQNAIVLDATAPHVLEPLFPGAGEQVVSLYHTFDTARLRQNEEAIRRLFAQCSALQKQAGRYYNGAGGFLLENARTAACFTDFVKVRAFAHRAVQRYLPQKGGGPGREQLRLLSAFTPDGIIVYRDTVPALARELCVFEDEYGTASRVILQILRDSALERGYDIITCRCATGFEQKIDHLFIPELGLGFLTSNSWHPMRFAGQKNVRCLRFIARDGLRRQAKRMRFVKKAAAGLMEQGFVLQRQALERHNELERYYQAAVRFSQVDAAREALAKELGL